ncbi:hypothetical protein Tco_0617010 [Tanacetum coccineum]
MGCAETIKDMLEIKVIEVGGDEELDEEVTGEELTTKKIIRFRLEGHRQLKSLLELARYLGLYSQEEILEEGFEYDKIQRNELWFLSMFVDKNHERTLDTTTLRELIKTDGRLIAEDPAPEILWFSMLRPPHLSNHSDRYTGVFKHMVGRYGV